MSLAQPHSLRTRLLWFLLAAIVATAAAQAVIAYRTALAEADDIFDYHMQQMALSLRAGMPVTGSAFRTEEIPHEEGFDFIVQIWTAEGNHVFQSARRILPDRAVLGFSMVPVGGTTFRIYSMQSGAGVIQVAQDVAVRKQMASTLAWRTVAPIVVMAPVLMLVAWWVVSSSLAPVARVRRQVAEHQVDDVREVSEVGLPEEIRPLVRELNLLFQRVRQAFEAQKSFVADAAHELRSPLAALRLQVQGLQRASDDAAREVAIGRLSAGIDRATRLVEQLLLLARHQAGAASGLRPEPVDLSEIARKGIADLAPLARERNIDLGMAHADSGRVSGHAEALRIMVRNLVDNAVKYSPQGGSVDVDVRRVDAGLQLSVEDSGPGIPEADRGRVFDRFHRVPGTTAPGSGLGLAIVKSIADLHGARIALGASERLGGLRVSVTFGAHD
ncbi:MAG: two-component sensor histidine kinase [Betaproteobacteria bacterium]|nr:MAG: two-component sensor histidine kinase [Betaproteobacteria bacterium]